MLQFKLDRIYAVVTKAAAYTVTLNDCFVRFDATSGALAPVLPSALSANKLFFRFKKIDSTANTVTITCAGSDTIDGAATKVLSAQYASVTLISNGVTWDIV